MTPAAPADDEVPGWTIPEQSALLVTPKVLGLPLLVLGVMVLVCLELMAVLHWFVESLFLFAVLAAGGRHITAKDPFAWTLLLQRPFVPKVLHP